MKGIPGLWLPFKLQIRVSLMNSVINKDFIFKIELGKISPLISHVYFLFNLKDKRSKFRTAKARLEL